MMSRALLLLLAGIALTAPAAGDEPPAAALFLEGRFVEAADAAGAEESSADAQALAAKAYSAAAILADSGADAGAWAQEALDHARAAVALEPAHLEGRLQLAVALWLESRGRGSFEAYRQGLPQEGRALIEAVLAEAPDDPWAQAMLGAWHFEVIRRGGGWAGRLLDADLEAGEAAFARAMALDPDDAAIPAHQGLAYLSLSFDRYRDPARAAFARALETTPRDAFETAMQARAREALRMMDEGDQRALEAAVALWVGGRG